MENPASSLTRLPRVASVEQWLVGGARRRALCVAVNGPAPIRRRAGDPAKDAVLRRLFDGERGPAFASMEELEREAARAAENLLRKPAGSPDPVATRL